MELQIQLLMSLLKAQKKHIMKSKCLMWLMQFTWGLFCDCRGMSGECVQKDDGNKLLNGILSDYLKMNEVGGILAKGAGTPSMIRKEYLIQAYNLGKNFK